MAGRGLRQIKEYKVMRWQRATQSNFATPLPLSDVREIMLGQQILAIQDHPTADNLQSFLKKHGYQLIWRATGEAGLMYLCRYHVHLLILETRLADVSGFDLCRQIRQQGFHQPILMLSEQDGELDKVLALEMGADDYVTKPYSQREVLARIRAMLRRAYGELASAAGERLCLGDLVIDRLGGQVWNAGKLVHLTPTEFRLLVHLAQHSSQVLSRAQIIDAVWGYEVDVNSEHVVNTHICRLREKVERDTSGSILIETVSGTGYRLNTTVT